jgi:ferrous iron transport protein A
MMPLSMLRRGEKSVVARINGNDEVRRFLNNLGVVVGEPISVVSEMGGNLILSVKGCRIAVDRSMAKRIMVSLQFDSEERNDEKFTGCETGRNGHGFKNQRRERRQTQNHGHGSDKRG